MKLERTKSLGFKFAKGKDQEKLIPKIAGKAKIERDKLHKVSN